MIISPVYFDLLTFLSDNLFLIADYRGFVRVNETYCKAISTKGNYDSFASAIEKCRKEDTCDAVIDQGCDGNGDFAHCRGEENMLPRYLGWSYSCVYKKKGIFLSKRY